MEIIRCTIVLNYDIAHMKYSQSKLEYFLHKLDSGIYLELQLLEYI